MSLCQFHRACSRWFTDFERTFVYFYVNFRIINIFEITIWLHSICSECSHKKVSHCIFAILFLVKWILNNFMRILIWNACRSCLCACKFNAFLHHYVQSSHQVSSQNNQCHARTQDFLFSHVNVRPFLFYLLDIWVFTLLFSSFFNFVVYLIVRRRLSTLGRWAGSACELSVVIQEILVFSNHAFDFTVSNAHAEYAGLTRARHAVDFRLAFSSVLRWVGRGSQKRKNIHREIISRIEKIVGFSTVLCVMIF